VTVRFAVNLDRFWSDEPVPRRFERAAAEGFRLAEFLYPQDHPEVVDQALAASGLGLSLFNVGVGDRRAGDRGLLAVPGREADFADAVARDLEFAARWDVTHLHAVGGRPEAPDRGRRSVDTAVANLSQVADRCLDAGVSIHVEFINDTDAPGYGLPTFEDAVAVVRAVDHPAVRLQFDQYHLEVVGSDPVAALAPVMDLVAYVQVADAVDRHEPAPGPSTPAAVVAALDAAGYDGVVGLEYDPRDDIEDALAWLEGRR
jgi:2-dehydrotetronate isomerase